MQLPQLPMLQPVPVPGCPATQADLNAAAAPGCGCSENPPPGPSAAGRVGGEKEKWNGNKLERKAGGRASYTRETLFQGFHTSKAGGDMPFPAAYRSWELPALPRAIRNKSKPGHSDARPPQVIIAVLPLWKINTQNT